MRNLAAVFVNCLVEVPLSIKDAHGNKGYAQIAGSLAVVTRQYAKATRVDRQAFVKTKLCTEVGDQVLFGINIFTDAGMHALLVIGIIGRQHPLKIFHENAVIGRSIQAFL